MPLLHYSGFIVESNVVLLNLSQSPWQSVLDYIRSQCNDFGFAMFDAVGFEGIQDGVACLTVPDQFRETWLNSHYGDLLRKAFSAVVGSSFVDYKIRQIAASARVPELRIAPPVPKVVTRAVKASRPKKQTFLGTPLYATYTFDNFVEGECNSVAVKACRTVVQKPGDMAMNPLLIYGSSGQGKTHLMQAVAREIAAQNPDVKIVYRQAYEFWRDCMAIVEAGRDKQYALLEELKERFKLFYMECDVLLIDDIQLLKKGVFSQERLAQVINNLRKAGKQVILSCDRHPAAFGKLAPGEKPSDDYTKEIKLSMSLLNYLETCVAVGIDEPDLKTRMEVIRKKSERLPFASADREEICRFLSVPPRANVRLIEGLLNWLDAMHCINGVDLTLRCVKQLLVSPKNDGAVLSLKNISETVAATFQVDMVVLSSKRQDKGASLPRKVAMYLCRELTSESLQDVGKHFNRDYATVIAAIQSLNAMMDKDNALAERVRDIRYMLEA